MRPLVASGTIRPSILLIGRTGGENRAVGPPGAILRAQRLGGTAVGQKAYTVGVVLMPQPGSSPDAGFDEQRLLDELEQLQLAIRETRATGARVQADFDTQLRAFDAPATPADSRSDAQSPARWRPHRSPWWLHRLPRCPRHRRGSTARHCRAARSSARHEKPGRD